MFGTIKKIETIHGFKIQPVSDMNGQNGARLGMAQMLNALAGYSEYDGYGVETDKHRFLVLIDNGQSCCENWGYLSSEDDLQHFIGAELRNVTATDIASKKIALALKEGNEWGLDEGAVRFVDFETDRGVFQLAVYNAHNGYYGHGVIVAKDNEILLNDTL